MAFNLPDMKLILRANLLKAPEVMALATGGVHTGYGREAEEATRKMPTLILDFRGGAPRGSGSPVQARAMWLWASSNVSQDEADILYQAAADFLSREGLMHPNAATNPACPQSCVYGIERSPSQAGRDDEVGAWFARGTWTMWGKG